MVLYRKGNPCRAATVVTAVRMEQDYKSINYNSVRIINIAILSNLNCSFSLEITEQAQRVTFCDFILKLK